MPTNANGIHGTTRGMLSLNDHDPHVRALSGAVCREFDDLNPADGEPTPHAQVLKMPDLRVKRLWCLETLLCGIQNAQKPGRMPGLIALRCSWQAREYHAQSKALMDRVSCDAWLHLRNLLEERFCSAGEA